MARILIGIGNPGRQDDAIGLVVAERFRKQFDNILKIQSLLPEDLPELRGYEEVIIVDGAVSIPEGEVKKFSLEELPGSTSTTHFIQLGDLIEIGRKLYPDFPKKITVIGVGIKNTGFDDQISVFLKKDLDRICSDIIKLLS